MQFTEFDKILNVCCTKESLVTNLYTLRIYQDTTIIRLDMNMNQFNMERNNLVSLLSIYIDITINKDIKSKINTILFISFETH